MIKYVKFYTRAMLRADPETLYVFGDNMARSGFGGQALACRGEPNAVGIPTKWRPSGDEDAFFKDSDFERVRTTLVQELEKLRQHLLSGGSVALPADGIGTGLAELPARAPKIHSYLTRELDALSALAPSGKMVTCLGPGCEGHKKFLSSDPVKERLCKPCRKLAARIHDGVV